MENETSEVAPEVTEEVGSTTETVETQSSDDLWESPLEFAAETPAEEEEIAGDPATPEVQNEVVEENTVETVEAAEVPAETEEQDPEILEAPADKPAPLSRKELRRYEEKILTVLRDPKAPVMDAFEGLKELNPERAWQLAGGLVHDAIKAYPNEWLQHITGIEGATIETVKQKFSGEPTQPDTFQQVVEHLDEYYGQDVWRDPSQDDVLLDDDRAVVQALRNHLSQGQQVESAKDAQIKALEEQLSKLQPEIDSIKTQQENEFLARVQNLKTEAVKDYTAAIEKRSLPDLFEQNGLTVSESDTDGVKAIKEFVRSQFQKDGDWMSNFEQFAVANFSGKDDLQKMVERVDKYFDEAVKAEAGAQKERDANKKADLLRTAEARRADARTEQDRLVVQHRRAAKEFLDKLKPLMDVLEENAMLQKQLERGNFRPEIIGQAATAGASTYRDRIAQAKTSDEVWEMPLEGLG